jgi:hypothetical protein
MLIEVSKMNLLLSLSTKMYIWEPQSRIIRTWKHNNELTLVIAKVVMICNLFLLSNFNLFWWFKQRAVPIISQNHCPLIQKLVRNFNAIPCPSFSLLIFRHNML